ncbi:hypothetical protein HHL14_16065 [Paraburkholderia sp. G-4-1-8]|uniref:Uncharacterized protein n=1 Tax=Paraburkholderia antibiotica TaxID=2728839 RepID=A0A7X9ZXY3_9BURK|nr:hypothetical protein [Paraburkholderia antibiotica]
MAATQIGIRKRMIGLALPDWPQVIANPGIVWTSDERMTLRDDCMCFPDMLVRVERRVSISLRFVDLDEHTHLREPNVRQAILTVVDNDTGHLAVA